MPPVSRPCGRWLALGALLLLTPGAANAQPSTETPHVRSLPDAVSWGWFPLDKAPILTIESGDTVTIDTISHAGSTQSDAPETSLAELGVQADEILPDVLAFWQSRDGRPREGRSGHVITGPIEILGAEPGDVLEVQVLALTPRVPWGINNTGPTSGVYGATYPGSRPGDRVREEVEAARHLYRTRSIDGDLVAVFSDTIHVPLAPFMGIMAVAPDPVLGEPGVTVAGVQASRPPGRFGGNMDVKDLGVGSTLYLPVIQPGALFYVGDPHSAQGDGEVSGTAIEQSLTGRFRFVLHKKDEALTMPWAETETHFIMMGIDLDLDRALQQAVDEVVAFLVDLKGLTPTEATSLASIAVDFQIAEAVDLTQLVTGKIPKNIFVEEPQ